MQKGELFDQLQESIAKHETAVPTKDIDVKKMLRLIKEPICLFGEDPIDRRNRLKKALSARQATDLDVRNNEVSNEIAKRMVGGAEVAELKAFLIDFSIPRAQRRIMDERRITQDRVDETNNCGRDFESYVLIASEFVEKRPLTHLAVSTRCFAVGSLSGCVSIYDIDSMKQISSSTAHDGRVTGLALVENVVCSASTDCTVCLRSVEANDAATISFDCPVNCVAVHPSSRVLLCGMSDGTFCVYDREVEKAVARMKSSDGTLSTLACHSDGGVVLAGGADSVARLWDLRSMQSIKVLQGHNDRVTCSTFGGSFHAVTGSADNAMICWDMRNVARSKKISGHTAPVSSVSIRGDLLMSSSLDKTIKIWSMLDFRTYRTISDCPYSCYGCAFAVSTSSPKPLVISVSKDGSWRYYGEDFL